MFTTFGFILICVYFLGVLAFLLNRVLNKNKPPFSSLLVSMLWPVIVGLVLTMCTLGGFGIGLAICFGLKPEIIWR